MGTFLPLENTHPFIGQKNVLEKVKEKRIETIVREREADRIIEEMIKAHPYEEVAYDLYPLENKGADYGYGRVGDIEEISMKALIEEIKRKLTVKNIRVYGGENKKINRIAVCGGSGGDFIYDAYRKNAQVYITGDIKYHEAQLAKELGLILIDSNHYDTEKIILPVIKEYILEHTNEKIEVDISDINSYGFQEY
jgi:putative NIF3 family GTP cyclohydrolase 1 type 2